MPELLLKIHTEDKKEKNAFNKCGVKPVLLHILTLCLREHLKETY
jgi:hypothetical protein